MDAILDRFDAVKFEPTRQEVLNELRRIYPQYLGEIDTIAALNVELSFRSFSKYLYWKRNEQFGFNALDNLVAEFGVNPAVVMIADVMKSTPKKLWRRDTWSVQGRPRKLHSGNSRAQGCRSGSGLSVHLSMNVDKWTSPGKVPRASRDACHRENTEVY